MSEEIKYRVWDKIDKKMLTVRALLFDKLNNNKLITILADNEDNKFTKAFTNEKYSYEHKDIITVPFENCSGLIQFTGLKDKNGVEIYEGDKIKIWSKYDKERYDIGEVFYHNRFAEFGVRGTNSLGYWFLHQYNIEVIGNIFESEVEKQK